jgi:hypothetical protein
MLSWEKAEMVVWVTVKNDGTLAANEAQEFKKRMHMKRHRSYKEIHILFSTGI